MAKHKKTPQQVTNQDVTRRRFMQGCGVLAAAAGTQILGSTSAKGARPGEMAGCDPRLINRLLDFIANELIPATRESVKKGNKIFGAGMLKKSDLSTIMVGTNNETENPLWHGEVNAIKLYYDMVNRDESKRVDPQDVIFITSHEPCPLCLSAITWAGFDNFYYLFSHEDSRDSFNIGHDLHILKEVFKQDPGGYARTNYYWQAYSIRDLINNCDESTKKDLLVRVANIKAAYAALSDVYQKEHKGKGKAAYIPLK